MISSVEIVPRMLISKVDEAMASRRPSEQWDKVRLRLLFFSLYVSVGMARERNEFVLHVSMDKLLAKLAHSDVTFVSSGAWDIPKAPTQQHPYIGSYENDFNYTALFVIIVGKQRYITVALPRRAALQSTAKVNTTSSTTTFKL